jgi:hypothetical protein
MDTRFLPLLLILTSVSAMAGEYSVTKVDTPNRIVVPGGTGLSVYTIGSRDIHSRHFGSVSSIEWSTTSYPQSVGEKAELCFRVFKGETRCVPIAPNSSGVSHDFINESFWPGAGLNIRHTTQAGGARNSKPAGQDTVTFNVMY